MNELLTNRQYTEVSIYKRMLELGVEISSNRSDLYVPVNCVTTELLARYSQRDSSSRVTFSTFFNNLTSTQWYCINFAYEPFWHRVSSGVNL